MAAARRDKDALVHIVNGHYQPPSANGGVKLRTLEIGRNSQEEKKEEEQEDGDAIFRQQRQRIIPSTKRDSKELDLKKVAAVATAVAVAQGWSNWMRWSGMLGGIFGGCCSNVFALESIIKPHPSAGLLITLVQFIFVTLVNLPSHASLSFSRLITLRPTTIPIRAYLPPIALFFLTNALNNLAFSYRISVPVHIILRSGGSVTTMLVGYLIGGKRYTRLQILAVGMITIGVVIAAFADARSKGTISSSSSASPSTSITTFTTGLLILLLAQLLSALMGLHTQTLYTRYGRSTASEFLFYSHLLSLPLFLPFLPSIITSFRTLAASEPITLPLPSHLSSSSSITVPKHLLALALNALTQYACISGVNLLSANSSALTVTVVLNVRKLISLVLSVWLFGGGRGLDPGVVAGAVWVFGGGGVYGWALGKAQGGGGGKEGKDEKVGEEKRAVKGMEEVNGLVGGEGTGEEKKEL